MQKRILPILKMSEMKSTHTFWQNDTILDNFGEKKLYFYSMILCAVYIKDDLEAFEVLAVFLGHPVLFRIFT